MKVLNFLSIARLDVHDSFHPFLVAARRAMRDIIIRKLSSEENVPLVMEIVELARSSKLEETNSDEFN